MRPGKEPMRIAPAPAEFMSTPAESTPSASNFFAPEYYDDMRMSETPTAGPSRPRYLAPMSSEPLSQVPIVTRQASQTPSSLARAHESRNVPIHELSRGENGVSTPTQPNVVPPSAGSDETTPGLAVYEPHTTRTGRLTERRRPMQWDRTSRLHTMRIILEHKRLFLDATGDEFYRKILPDLKRELRIAPTNLKRTLVGCMDRGTRVKGWVGKRREYLAGRNEGTGREQADQFDQYLDEFISLLAEKKQADKDKQKTAEELAREHERRETLRLNMRYDREGRSRNAIAAGRVEVRETEVGGYEDDENGMQEHGEAAPQEDSDRITAQAAPLHQPAAPQAITSNVPRANPPQRAAATAAQPGPSSYNRNERRSRTRGARDTAQVVEENQATRAVMEDLFQRDLEQRTRQADILQAINDRQSTEISELRSEVREMRGWVMQLLA